MNLITTNHESISVNDLIGAEETCLDVSGRVIGWLLNSDENQSVKTLFKQNRWAVRGFASLSWWWWGSGFWGDPQCRTPGSSHSGLNGDTWGGQTDLSSVIWTLSVCVSEFCLYWHQMCFLNIHKSWKAFIILRFFHSCFRKKQSSYRKIPDVISWSNMCKHLYVNICLLGMDLEPVLRGPDRPRVCFLLPQR